MWIVASFVVVGYLGYLLSLGFSGAYDSLMGEREADPEPILMLDHVVIMGASLMVALVAVPQWLETHIKFVGLTLGFNPVQR